MQPHHLLHRLLGCAPLFLFVVVVSFDVPGRAAPPLTPNEIAVPFGTGPLKADPTRNQVYFVDLTYKRLLAVDTTTGEQVYSASVDDGLTLSEIAISIDGTKLYLGESEKDEIMVFSLPTLAPLPTIHLGFRPFGLASAVGGLLLTTNADADNFNTAAILEINPSTGAVIGSFGVGRVAETTYIRTNTDGTNLYALGLFAIDEYSLTGAQPSLTASFEMQNIELNNTGDFVPDEAYERLYLNNGTLDGYGLYVYSIADGSSAMWPFTGFYSVGIGFNPQLNVVFGAAGSSGNGDIREFNRADGTPLADYVVSTDNNAIEHSGIAATANGNLFYIRGPVGYPPFSSAELGLLTSTGLPVTLHPTIAQTITFPTINNALVGQVILLQASGSSGLPVIYTVVSGPATISGSRLTVTGAGTIVFAVQQTGNVVYEPSTQLTQTITSMLVPQTIGSFSIISDKTYSASSFAITLPTASSGLPVTITVKSGPATISGNIVSLTGAGVVTLAADQSGNSMYAAAPEKTTSFAVNKAPQTIGAVAVVRTKIYTATPFAITLPTASSGLPVTVTVQSGPATISGNSVTMTGMGKVVLAADQAGNSNYLPASTVTTSFTIRDGTQTITPFQVIETRAYSPVPFTIVLPTASSGLPVTVTVQSGPSTISGNTITMTGPGKVVLAANQAGNSGFVAARQITTTFTVGKDPQTIAAFTPITGIILGSAPFSITPPVATSGLPVTVAVKSGPGKLAGNVLTLTGVGTVTLFASQTGNSTFAAAIPVMTTFEISKKSQTIAPFSFIPAPTFGAAPFAITPPNADSGLPVTVKILSGPATLFANKLTIKGGGTVVLAANQAGNADYSAATEVTTSFVVNPQAQTIAAFATLSAKTYSTTAFAVVGPKATSGLPVILSVLSGPATILAGKVTLTGVGTVTLAADQAGNSNYAAATEVTISFTVSKASQAIAAFRPIPSKVVGSLPFAIIVPKASSGLPVTVTVKSGPATISGDIITVTAVGTVVMAANQPGDANHNVAAEATTSFAVN